MATQVNFSGSADDNAYINSLVWGCKWSGSPITYAFGVKGYTLDGAATLNWSTAEKLMFKDILTAYSSVCNVVFKEVALKVNSAAANLVEWKTYDIGDDVLAWHEVPDNTYVQTWGLYTTNPAYWSTKKGSLGYSSVVHELGHALGLAHPHDGGDDGDIFPGVDDAFDSYGSPDSVEGQNQGIWTVMSYNAGWAAVRPTVNYQWGDVITPMALDVYALQSIYGINTTFNSNDNIYSLPQTNTVNTGWSCLWDTGGVDTISAGATKKSCSIDLREAPITTGQLDDELSIVFGENAGGYVSSLSGILGGYTIAKGAIIENAIGGSGSDMLIGNAADNVLDGKAGRDFMFGGIGNDTFIVDNINDEVWEYDELGIDSVKSSVSISSASADAAKAALLSDYVENIELTGTGKINATGNDLDNTIIGNSSNNLIVGGEGSDVLNGGAGNDSLMGGSGNDSFYFSTKLNAKTNLDAVLDFNVVDDTLVLAKVIFSKLTVGLLSTVNFIAGDTAADSNDYIIFNALNGRLSYDSDGNGSNVAIQFATISVSGSLVSNDFLVI